MSLRSFALPATHAAVVLLATARMPSQDLLREAVARVDQGGPELIEAWRVLVEHRASGAILDALPGAEGEQDAARLLACLEDAACPTTEAQATETVQRLLLLVSSETTAIGTRVRALHTAGTIAGCNCVALDEDDVRQKTFSLFLAGVQTVREGDHADLLAHAKYEQSRLLRFRQRCAPEITLTALLESGVSTDHELAAIWIGHGVRVPTAEDRRLLKLALVQPPPLPALPAGALPEEAAKSVSLTMEGLRQESTTMIAAAVVTLPDAPLVARLRMVERGSPYEAYQSMVRLRGQELTTDQVTGAASTLGAILTTESAPPELTREALLTLLVWGRPAIEPLQPTLQAIAAGDDDEVARRLARMAIGLVQD